MYKIAISGKANAGKSTVAKILYSQISPKSSSSKMRVALADPIKEIIKIMFPRTKHAILYGPSKNRAQVIPDAFLKDEPLNYRKLLQNLGTEVGRGYKESIWLDVLDYKIENAEKKGINIFIVEDARFKNECDHLKNIGFTMIRVVRDEQLSLNHSSELEQESIKDHEFHFIINNSGSKDDLKDKVLEICSQLNIE